MRIFKLSNNIPKENTGGDCYEVAGRYLMDNGMFGGKTNLILAHGIVTGQGAIQGIKYDHAWIEDGEEVIDQSNGRNIKMPKDVYYALGQITDVKRYNIGNLRRMVTDHRHWGPWE